MSNGNKVSSMAVALLATIGLIITGGVTTVYRRRRRTAQKGTVPIIVWSKDGQIHKLESFSRYVARQFGITDAERYPSFLKVSDDYLRGMIKGWEEDACALFPSAEKNEAKALFDSLVAELDACMLSYFAFYWSHADSFITQALPPRKSQLRNVVRAATRDYRAKRIERVTKDHKVTRIFDTLVEEIKAMRVECGEGVRDGNTVMVAANAKVRSPVLLLLAGGMGAGKSTVLKDVLKEGFWAEAAKDAVVVEADAFKTTDLLFKALSSTVHDDMIHTAELVHQSSINAASSLLVTALNEGRDVIMDGTLSWEPFVSQTIAMVRDVHRRRYRMGPGYQVADDGSVIENYWEEVKEEEDEKENYERDRKPYRIELVGVVCDAHLAVVRGIRRAIIMGRAVRVKSQLRSHKLFATNFPMYLTLVDHARLYCTNAMGGPAEVIGRKDGSNRLLVDLEDYGWLKKVAQLNENAESIEELYTGYSDPGMNTRQIFELVVSSPSRKENQLQLMQAITKSETVYDSV